MIIVTAGNKYMDIDAYAGIIAYRELLLAEGEDAKVIAFGKTNKSVPKSIQQIGYQLDEATPEELENAKYVIIDTSNPEYLDSRIKQENVVSIIDHHPGNESFWENYNLDLDIKMVGAACTLVYELIVERGHLEIITPSLAKMLAAAILDNTTNFLVGDIDLTRDKKAYEHLCKIAKIDDSWAETYFAECYSTVQKDFEKIIEADLKILPNTYNMPPIQGQIIVPSEKSIVSFTRIKKLFSEYDDWFLNIICLKERRSIIYCSQKAAQDFKKIFHEKFDSQKILLKEVVLRKIIAKKFLDEYFISQIERYIKKLSQKTVPTDIIGFGKLGQSVARAIEPLVGRKEICFFDENVKSDSTFHYLDFEKMLEKSQIMIFTTELPKKYFSSLSRLNKQCRVFIPKELEHTINQLRQYSDIIKI